MNESTTSRKPPAIRCPIFKEICCYEKCAAYLPNGNSCTLCGGEKLMFLERIARSLEFLAEEMRRK